MEEKGYYFSIKNQLASTLGVKQDSGKGLKKLGKNRCVHFARLSNRKKHFILECDAFKDIRESYGNMLASVSWHCLFNDEIVGRLGQLIINLNKKRIEMQKAKNRKLIVP